MIFYLNGSTVKVDCEISVNSAAGLIADMCGVSLSDVAINSFNGNRNIGTCAVNDSYLDFAFASSEEEAETMIHL